MSNKLKHRGYTGSIEVSVEDGCLHGKILFVQDVVTYEGSTVPELQKQFEEAVDDYLVFCEEVGREPDKPCSGTFNIRIKPELHREAVIKAAEKNFISLNDFVAVAIEEKVHKTQEPIHHLHEHRITLVRRHHLEGKYMRAETPPTDITPLRWTASPDAGQKRDH